MLKITTKQEYNQYLPEPRKQAVLIPIQRSFLSGALIGLLIDKICALSSCLGRLRRGVNYLSEFKVAISA